MKSFRLRFFLIIIFLTTSITFFVVSNNILVLDKYKKEHQQIKKTIKENEEKILALNNHIDFQDTDEFIEKIAREQLGFIKDDEFIFIIK